MTSWWTPCEVLQETSLAFTSTLGTGSDDIYNPKKLAEHLLEIHA